LTPAAPCRPKGRAAQRPRVQPNGY
jgi:hypothetical protein